MGKYSSSKDEEISSGEKRRSDPKLFSENDDHYTHREKAILRQRSKSKDSNDGFTRSNVNFVSSSSEQSKSKNPSSKRCTDNTEKNVSNSISKDNLKQWNSSPNLSRDHSKLYSDHTEDEKVLLLTQPVVIDQILHGNDLDLESFIGKNRNNPIVSSIEKSLSRKIKIPKMAENVFEAKRMMKIRKQIELSNQKRIGK